MSSETAVQPFLCHKHGHRCFLWKSSGLCQYKNLIKEWHTHEFCIINEDVIICALDYRVQLLIRRYRATGDGERSWSEELKAPRCLWPPPFLPRHQLSALSASQMLLQRGGILRWHHSRGGRSGTRRAGEVFENLLITLHLLEKSLGAEERRSLKAVRSIWLESTVSAF